MRFVLLIALAAALSDFDRAIELVTEATGTHYMSAGGDGYIDIFGYSKSGEDLTELQTQELKNGRLAMIGIASFFSACLVPDSVPGYPWPV